MAMAGAGGGGFLYGILKDGATKETVRAVLSQHSDFKAELYDASIAVEGMELVFV